MPMLTDVILMVHDWVVGHILLFEVSLWGFYVVGALMALNETLKFPIHDRAMGQSALSPAR